MTNTDTLHEALPICRLLSSPFALWQWTSTHQSYQYVLFFWPSVNNFLHLTEILNLQQNVKFYNKRERNES